jgi:hypothetical protein
MKKELMAENSVILQVLLAFSINCQSEIAVVYFAFLEDRNFSFPSTSVVLVPFRQQELSY